MCASRPEGRAILPRADARMRSIHDQISLLLLIAASLDSHAPLDLDGRMETRFFAVAGLLWISIVSLMPTGRRWWRLRRPAEKLYRRNPKEWRKSGQPSPEAAVNRLFSGAVSFPELEGRREVAALYAFSPN